jgi:predicted amidophosphoribosyltransferase
MHMGLFDKKFCSVCGAKIGLFGNRKLEDGNLCKDCASKLSPWMTDRRQSTVEEIKQHLAYREQNKAAVAAFHATKTFGNNTKVIIDEDAGNFWSLRRTAGRRTIRMFWI